MKKIVPLIVFVVATLSATGQDSADKIMEDRAREMYRVIGLTDKEQYKKFMQENYTKVFLEKPVKISKVVSDSDNGSSPEKNKPVDHLEGKTQMYVQLHNDFGGSKLVSITRKENKIEMVLSATSGLTGTFTFTFEKNKPYLIDALGIQAEMNK